MDKVETQLFERSVIALEKMAKGVAHLRTDVNRLSQKIGTPEVTQEEFDSRYTPPDEPKNFREVLRLFEKTRKEMLCTEASLARCTGLLDQVISGGYTREELMPYFKDKDA